MKRCAKGVSLDLTATRPFFGQESAGVGGRAPVQGDYRLMGHCKLVRIPPMRPALDNI